MTRAENDNTEQITNTSTGGQLFECHGVADQMQTDQDAAQQTDNPDQFFGKKCKILKDTLRCQHLLMDSLFLKYHNHQFGCGGTAYKAKYI
jgi:hypothetical protein